MQYFASFEPFEIFDEFNGVKGTYIKSFLISDKINLNKWQATHEANVANIDTFLGRPGIHYINPETKKRDHTGAPTKHQSLQLQELYRAASIIAVGTDIATKKNWQVSKMIDDEVSQKIKTREIRWISPSIWPRENAVEQIEQTDGTVIDVVHDYDGLHYAFVDEPAYEDEAEIKSFCDGTTKECQNELAMFSASIDNVAPITERKIKQNSSDSKSNTSLNDNTSTSPQMATEEEKLRKELEDAKKAQDEIKKELEDMKKESKKGMDEEDDKKDKETEGKKGQDNEDKDEEKEALKAQVAALTAQAKIPLIDKIVSAQLSASVISKSDESKTRSALMNASLEDLTRQYETIKPFEAKLKSYERTGDSGTIPYMGSVSDPSEDYSLDASVDDMDFDELMEVGNQ